MAEGETMGNNRNRRNATNPRRAVAYLWTSTDEQQLGPAAQRLSIERWAAARGVEVVACFEDHVCGATPPEGRPGLLDALHALRVHGAGLLIAAKRDRVARDPSVARLVEREAERVGAHLVSAAGEGEGDTPEAVFQRGVVDLCAELERGKIRQRTREALAVKRSRGERIGQVPFGFKLSDDLVHLEPEPSELAVIVRVRELRGAGVSLRAIVERLNVEGATCRGTRWHLSGLARVARRAEAQAA
jgi:DNA invertase Pin-like site-specific DNA recombinase